MYETHYSRRGLLTIKPYDPASFAATHYCFRLGATKEKGQVNFLNQPLHLPPGQSKVLLTLETFVLSERTLALIGPRSELVCKGVLLHHSPCIDPGFNGCLELLIENVSDQPYTLLRETPIGKALFFDISDTSLDLQELRARVEAIATWRARQEAGRMIQEWIEKKIDREGPIDLPVGGASDQA
jgi:dUTPase